MAGVRLFHNWHVRHFKHHATLKKDQNDTLFAQPPQKTQPFLPFLLPQSPPAGDLMAGVSHLTRHNDHIGGGPVLSPPTETLLCLKE